MDEEVDAADVLADTLTGSKEVREGPSGGEGVDEPNNDGSNNGDGDDGSRDGDGDDEDDEDDHNGSHDGDGSNDGEGDEAAGAELDVEVSGMPQVAKAC